MDNLNIDTIELTDINAEIISNKNHFVGDTIDKNEILVKGTYRINENKFEVKEINYDDWYFVTIPIINDNNKGVFVIQSDKYQAIVKFEYQDTKGLRLNIWYEGAKILIGNSYDPINLIVFLIDKNGNRKELSYKDIQLSGYTVYQDGWNFFTATYTNQYIQISQQYAVPAYSEYIYPEVKFKVMYIDKLHNNRLIDYTEEFKEFLYYQDVLYVSLEAFLKCVNHMQKYGEYIVTVPKECGLSSKYDMDWNILSINETTIKANINKIYL